MNILNKLSLLLLPVLLVGAGFLWLSSNPVSADNDADYRVKSGANNQQVDAASVSMRSLPLKVDAQTPKPPRKIKKHSRPFEVNPEYLQQLEEAAHLEGKAIARQDERSLALSKSDGEPCQSYLGMESTGWVPPDPHAAAGTNQIVTVVNSSIAVFSTVNGNPLYQVAALDFFDPVDPPSSFIFDPKVVYDPFEDRFIILYLCTDDVSQSSYLVGVSKTGDALGEWWLYDLDAGLNGTEPVDHWPDYPGLGFDYSDAVYITSNQHGYTSGYAYVKIRLLKKAELYAGSISGWHDFWDMRYHDNEVAFTIKPAVTLSDAGGEYLLSNIWYGADYTTFWKITDAATESPVLTREPRVDLAAAYSFPPNPTQAGTDGTLIPIGPMTQEVFYRNDKLYTVFSQSYNWGSGEVAALRLVGIETGTALPFLDEIYGADGMHYFYPSIATDFQDKIYMSFNTSGNSTYPGISYVTDYMSDNSSYEMRTGRGYYGGPAGNFRYGDYGSISIDPTQRSAWIFHEWSTVSHDWSTWFGEIPGPPAAPLQIYPADGATLPSDSAYLQWNCAAADSYLVEVDLDPYFISPLLTVLTDEKTLDDGSFISGYDYYWRIRSINHCGTSDISPIWSFNVCDIVHGDANGSDEIDIDDVVFLISYIFASGPPPDPYWMGDANCSLDVDIDDAVYLITFIFQSGPEPCGGC